MTSSIRTKQFPWLHCTLANIAACDHVARSSEYSACTRYNYRLCSAVMASRKAKVEFSDEEKEELLKAFEGGMNSVSKDRLPKIQELARALQKEENEIKVCIWTCKHRNTSI